MSLMFFVLLLSPFPCSCVCKILMFCAYTFRFVCCSMVKRARIWLTEYTSSSWAAAFAASSHKRKAIIGAIGKAIEAVTAAMNRAQQRLRAKHGPSRLHRKEKLWGVQTAIDKLSISETFNIHTQV